MRELFVVGVVVLWVVFLASAVSKVSGPGRQRAFRESLRPLQIVPEPIVAAVALAVTAVEVVVVTGLSWVLLGVATGAPETRAVAVPALLVAAGLLAVLIGGIAVALRRGTRAPCACFGVASTRPLSGWHLSRNGLLLTALCGAWAAAAGPPVGAVVGLSAVLLLGVVGGVLALVLIRLEDLVDLFAPAVAAGAGS